MKGNDLGAHISATYRKLRLGIAVFAFLLPPLLWVGGRTLSGLPLQDSMSAYYHAGDGAMRDEFVGILIAVGTILLVYQGITKLEDLALNLAGVFALGVALKPMSWPAEPGFGTSLHGVFAIAFFSCIAYVCIFRASDTLPLLDDPGRRAFYHLWYRVFGWAMPLSPVAAWLATSLLEKRSFLVFFIEALGVWVFGGFWFLKSREIAEINKSTRLARRRLRAANHGLRDAFRPIALVADTEGNP